MKKLASILPLFMEKKFIRNNAGTPALFFFIKVSV